MAQETVTSLDLQVHRIFELVDSMDTDAMAAMITDDGQGVDEISRAWMRGRDALEAYFGQLDGMVESLTSEISDLHVTEWADTAVATCVVDQTYVMGGERQTVRAPTSITFRREDDWKIAVFHSVPLPQQPPR